MSTSKKINEDKNNNRVGMCGGRKASDLNNSSHNRMKHPSDTDHDGKPDRRTHTELSEHPNNGMAFDATES